MKKQFFIYTTGKPNPVPLVSLMLSVLLIFSGACKPTAPPTVTVTATLKNSPDVPLTETLTLSYPPARKGLRVVSLEGAGLTYLRDITLETRSPGLSADSYYLQVFSQPATYSTGDPVDHTVFRTGNFSFIDTHTGALAALAFDAPSVGSAAATNAPGLDPKRTFVSAWLARVEQNDVALRWTVLPTDPGCQLVAPGDCFDLNTLTTTLTTTLTGGLQAAFDPPAGGGADPNSNVRFRGVSLVSYIPNVVPALDAPGRRVRGFAFVFRLDLQARAAGGTVTGTDVGTLYHDVSVWVPIALLLESDGLTGLQLTIDPLDLAGGSSSQMVGRIAVEVTNPGPGPIETMVGQEIGNRALTGVRAVLGSPLPGANWASGVLAGFFGRIRSSGRLAEDFDVILIPESGAPLNGTVVSSQLVPAAALPGVQLIILE